MKRYLFFVVFAIVLAFGHRVCAEVRVVSSIPDFGAIAQEVGRKLVSVDSMVRPTQDPHYVDAKPSLMVTLNRADLLLVTGMELESGWLPPLMTGARNPKVLKGGAGYLDCSTLIKPMDEKAVDRSKGDIHPGGNPHYWTDPRNGVLLARGIAAKLIEIDPGNAEAYRAGRDDFVRRLEAKMREWGKRLAPKQGMKVVVYHDSWVYFLDWAGIDQAGELEPKPGIPPQPAHVAELIRRTRDQGIRYVIQEAFYPTRLSTLFAQKAGAELKVLPTMVGAAGTKSYFDVIETLVASLTN